MGKSGAKMTITSSNNNNNGTIITPSTNTSSEVPSGSVIGHVTTGNSTSHKVRSVRMRSKPFRLQQQQQARVIKAAPPVPVESVERVETVEWSKVRRDSSRSPQETQRYQKATRNDSDRHKTLLSNKNRHANHTKYVAQKERVVEKKQHNEEKELEEEEPTWGWFVDPGDSFCPSVATY